MLNRAPSELSSGRTLPLRNEKLSISSPNALALPNHIWFTPEVIIFDALDILAQVILLWEIFKRAFPSFAFRVATLIFLIFLVTSFKQQPASVAADGYQVNSLTPTSNQATTKITAQKAPVYSWPVKKSYISRFFSFYHKGIDLPAPHGAPVKAFCEGEVVFAGWDGGFGKTVIIRHERGYSSKYAHLSGINVTKDQKVSRQSTVGSVGTTGITTGPHLHFEIHKNGRPIDPLTILP